MTNKKQNTSTLSDDAIYTLYFNSKLKKSKKDIEGRKVLTVKESKERIKSKYANSDI